MPTSDAVFIAVKYASQMRRNALIRRLTKIGQQKMQEEKEKSEDEDDEDFETKHAVSFISSSARHTNGHANGHGYFSIADEYSESQDFGDSDSNSRDASSTSNETSRRKSVAEGMTLDFWISFYQTSVTPTAILPVTTVNL